MNLFYIFMRSIWMGMNVASLDDQTVEVHTSRQYLQILSIQENKLYRHYIIAIINIIVLIVTAVFNPISLQWSRHITYLRE